MDNTMNSIVLTLIFDGQFYCALLQKEDGDQLTLAKHIFGAEPSDADIYQFTLTELQKLRFSEPEKMAENLVARAKINFKRRMRMVKKEMQAQNIQKETYTQELKRLELEKGAKLKRKKLAKEKRIAIEKERFQQKQLQKKQKKKGH
jgi:hypothetical protein